MSAPLLGGDAATKNAAAVAHAFAAAGCPPCDDSNSEEVASKKLAELTMSSASIPSGVGMATGGDASAKEGALAGCRLASSNQFVLNPDEPQRSMQELVQALMEELEGGKKDLNRLYNLMMSYDHAGNEWQRYQYIDDKKKYTRNLIACVPDSFCLMLLCWNGEKASPIHNHAGSECFLRVLSGEIVEQQFIVKDGEGDLDGKANWNQMPACANIPASSLILTNRNVYTEGGCTFINDSLGVHAVENPHKKLAVTLHCYIPGYDACKSYSADVNEKDADKSVKIQQCHISFDTEQGERTHG